MVPAKRRVEQRFPPPFHHSTVCLMCIKGWGIRTQKKYNFGHNTLQTGEGLGVPNTGSPFRQKRTDPKTLLHSNGDLDQTHCSRHKTVTG